MPAASQNTVLCVDDEANILKALKRSLRQLKVKVLTADSGQQALTLLAEQSVDVIVSDMRMPGMTGAELLTQANSLYPNTQRILLTGYSDMDSTVQAINSGGVSRYVAKPWDDEELRKIVADAIELATLKRENQALQSQLQAHNEQLEDKVEKRTEALEQSNLMLNEAVADLSESYDLMVDLLANLAALPQREPESTQRKLELAVAMAEELGLDDEEKQTIRHATRLHRIGWCALPESVTGTPRDSHDDAQRKAFEEHPVYAEALLMSVPKLSGVASILKAQHERHDGAGFPDHVATEGIPVGARILAVARDYFDMQSGRLTGEQAQPGNAAAAISADAGRAYDPQIVTAFSVVLPKLEEVGAQVEEVRVNVRALQEGMQLSRDLNTPEGARLLPKDAQLSEEIIAKLINLEERSELTLNVYIKHDKKGTP